MITVAYEYTYQDHEYITRSMNTHTRLQSDDKPLATVR